MKQGNVALSAVGLVLALSMPGWAQLPPICIPRLSNIIGMGQRNSFAFGDTQQRRIRCNANASDDRYFLCVLGDIGPARRTTEGPQPMLPCKDPHYEPWPPETV